MVFDTKVRELIEELGREHNGSTRMVLDRISTMLKPCERPSEETVRIYLLNAGLSKKKQRGGLRTSARSYSGAAAAPKKEGVKYDPIGKYALSEFP